jgi:hypothetical protein
VRKRERKRENEKEGERENCYFLFVKGMTAALAPFSYLLNNK